MRSGVMLLALAACGRIGFDETGDTPPQTPVLGILDDTFGDGGVVRTEPPDGELRPYAVLGRPGGYLVVGVRAVNPTNRIALIGLTLDGELDATFGTAGLADVGATVNDFGYSATRVGPDRILVGGDGRASNGTLDDITVGLLDDRGAPVPTFGADGFVRLDVEGARREDTARRAAFLDGSVVACGTTGYDLDDGEFVLARLDLAGAPIAAWGTGGETVDSFVQGALAECMDVAQLDDRLIAVGRGTTESLVVAAYFPDGTRDPTFAGGAYMYSRGNGTNAKRVAVVEGDIVAVGEDLDGAVAIRLAADGTPVTTFGDGGVFTTSTIDHFDALVVQPDGKIIVAGTAEGAGIVVRFAADGTFDPTFGTGGSVEIRTAGELDVQDLHLDAEGRLVIVAIEDGRAAVTARIR